MSKQLPTGGTIDITSPQNDFSVFLGPKNGAPGALNNYFRPKGKKWDFLARGQIHGPRALPEDH